MGRRVPTFVCILTLLLAAAVSTQQAETAGIASVPATVGGYFAGAINFVAGLFSARSTPAAAHPAAVASAGGGTTPSGATPLATIAHGTAIAQAPTQSPTTRTISTYLPA